MTVLAKEYGMSAAQLNKLLNKLGVIYNLDGTWVLYAKYQDKGYQTTQTTYLNTKKHIFITNGRKFIHNLLIKNKLIKSTKNEQRKNERRCNVR